MFPHDGEFASQRLLPRLGGGDQALLDQQEHQQRTGDQRQYDSWERQANDGRQQWEYQSGGRPAELAKAKLCRLERGVDTSETTFERFVDPEEGRHSVSERVQCREEHLGQ